MAGLEPLRPTKTGPPIAKWESNVIRPDFGGGRAVNRSEGDHLHSLLDLLAEMDLEYEAKRSMIANSACDLDFKERILRKFKQRHRARREPFLAQLVLLQGCVSLDRSGA